MHDNRLSHAQCHGPVRQYCEELSPSVPLGYNSVINPACMSVKPYVDDSGMLSRSLDSVHSEIWVGWSKGLGGVRGWVEVKKKRKEGNVKVGITISKQPYILIII